MSKRKFDEMISEEGTSSPCQSEITGDTDDASSSPNDISEKMDSNSPSGSITYQSSGDRLCSGDCIFKSEPCARCHEDSTKKMATRSTTGSVLSRSCRGDTNEHSIGKINETSSDNADSTNVGLPDICSDSKRNIDTLGNTPDSSVSELTMILSSDDIDHVKQKQDIVVKTKVASQPPHRRILKPILKLRNRNRRRIDMCGDEGDSLPKSAIRNTSQKSTVSQEYEKSQQEKVSVVARLRESMESNPESLSDKEIESDNVFDSSNDPVEEASGSCLCSEPQQSESSSREDILEDSKSPEPQQQQKDPLDSEGIQHSFAKGN